MPHSEDASTSSRSHALPKLRAAAGRVPRSRLDRPCDTCRKHKHLCVIPVKGEPCESCKSRQRECTFDAPPTSRKRKARDSADLDSGGVGRRSSSTAAATAAPEQEADYSRAGREPALDFSFEGDEAHFDTRSVRSLENANQPIVHPPSLDLEETDDQESHFLGAGSFSGVTLADISNDVDVATNPGASPTLSFRQVSADPRLPAYFVKHKALLYGRTPTTSRAAFEAVRQACAAVGDDIVSQCLSMFIRVTLPALPFVNSKRLETACLGQQDSGPIPYALLAGIVPHCTSYIPEIRRLHTTLWAHALLGMEEEYRQPKLRTLQLAMLLLVSRPSENSGQTEIALTRAIGAAHLLGLHMDPSRWALPLWERNLRKRMWWTLVVHDKWRALLFGRPSNIHAKNHNHSLPEVEEGDWGGHASPTDRLSLESFVVTCRLTQVIDRLLDGFFTVEACLRPMTYLTRVGLLEDIRTELDRLERTLDPRLQWQQTASDRIMSTLPTGIRSMQLSLLGLQVVIHRLLLVDKPIFDSVQGSILMENTIAICSKLVDFVLNLSSSDRGLFWMPYSHHHIANCASLLLRLELNTLDLNPDFASRCGRKAQALIEKLIEIYTESGWDVAESALRRLASPLLTTSHHIPDNKTVYRSVAKALHLPIPEDMQATEDLLKSNALQDFDPSMWLGMDFSWLTNGNGSGFDMSTQFVADA